MMQPAASAGAILKAASVCGKFHGTIAPTTPTGLRRTSMGPPITPSRRADVGVVRTRFA